MTWKGLEEGTGEGLEGGKILVLPLPNFWNSHLPNSCPVLSKVSIPCLTNSPVFLTSSMRVSSHIITMWSSLENLLLLPPQVDSHISSLHSELEVRPGIPLSPTPTPPDYQNYPDPVLIPVACLPSLAGSSATLAALHWMVFLDHWVLTLSSVVKQTLNSLIEDMAPSSPEII